MKTRFVPLMFALTVACSLARTDPSPTEERDVSVEENTSDMDTELTHDMGVTEDVGPDDSGPDADENVVGTYEQASMYLTSPHAARGSLDLHPSNAAELTTVLGDELPEGAEFDFEGHSRYEDIAGAFVSSTGPPLILNAPDVPQ